MLSQVVINSVNFSSLIIGPFEEDYIHVQFSTSDVQVKIRPYFYNDGKEMALFFDALAAHWKGWDGVKRWKSVEGDFILEATSEKIGYVNLIVTLITNQSSQNEWKFTGNLRIEASSLSKLSDDIKRIFNKSKP